MKAANEAAVKNGRAWQHALLSSTQRAINAISCSGQLVAVACLLVMFAALLVNVILRYVFGTGITWAYEIHALLLPWLVGGGIVIAMARSRHIAITLLPEALKDRQRLILALLIHIIVLAISIGILATSQPILKAAQFQNLSTLGVKQIWGYASLVYAFVCVALISSLNIGQALLRGKADAQSPEQSSLS